MSAFAETRTLPAAREVSTPTASPAVEIGDEASAVRYWRKRIESREALDDYKEWEKYAEEAKRFGKGQLLDDDDIQSWSQTGRGDPGVIVQVNLWRRIRAYYVDAVFSNNPNLAFRPKAGRSDPALLKQAAAVEAMMRYVWGECKQQAEARRALKDAWNKNVSVVKTDYDRARGLYRARWVPGAFVVDSECHGDLTRATWWAEKIRLPAARILEDDTFAAEKRLKLYERWKGSIHRGDLGGNEQLKTLYYVTSREGIDPLAAIKELAGETPTANGPKKVLFAIVEGFDEFLFTAPDPFPYLDEDEANYAVLTLDEEPGEWYGSPQWKILKGLIDAINWLVSFHVTIMKKKATNVVLVNKAIWKDGKSKLAGSSPMEVHDCDGPGDQAAHVLDLGSGDAGQLQSAEALHEWLARISGFNEVAQGESSGRKTAEEARYLQQNTSLVTKGSNISFDAFLNDMLHQVALATLYYVPQFSHVVGPDGSVMTQQVAMQPVADPMTGMTQPQPTAVSAPVDTETAQQYGAQSFVMNGQDFGMHMPDTAVTMSQEMLGPEGETIPGAPIFRNERAGEILRRGVEYFCGAEVAMNWPTQPLEDVKRDLLFTFEAGSTRADFRYDQQQAAVMALNLLGPIYQQTGALDAFYELLVVITQSLPLDNSERLVPPREQFIGGMQQAMVAAQAQQQDQQGRAEKKDAREERKTRATEARSAAGGGGMGGGMGA